MDFERSQSAPICGGSEHSNAQDEPSIESDAVPPSVNQDEMVQVPAMTNSIRRIGQDDGVLEQTVTIVSPDGDAPGQSGAYIPPGDHRKEFYRLGTFRRFPATVPVAQRDLAKAGFYYTGFKDRVKCFSCGMCVENWIAGDDGMDARWHRSNCPLTHDRELYNLPITTPNCYTRFREFKENARTASSRSATGSGIPSTAGNSADVQIGVQRCEVSTAHTDWLRQLSLRSEAERRKTFAKWPLYPAPYLASILAKNGFFYLGNLDWVQCFSCSGILCNWAPQDNVREQHLTNFSHCRMVRNLDAGNIPMTHVERQQADRAYHEKRDRTNSIHSERPNPPPPAEEQRRLAQRFPCENPLNPRMASLHRRIETFDQRWLKMNIRSSVEQLAKAGFFFLGEGDQTKCFYCNGGLQNWDRNDEPWTEHAKQFPGCEYILRHKGLEYVRQLAESHLNLNQSQIRNPVLSYNLSPQSESETLPKTTINITQVMDMGFSIAWINRCIEAKASRGGYISTEELVQDLLDKGGILQSEDDTAVSNLPTDFANTAHLQSRAIQCECLANGTRRERWFMQTESEISADVSNAVEELNNISYQEEPTVQPVDEEDD